MEFAEVKELICKMQNHPYMIAQKINIYNPGWASAVSRMIGDIEGSLENENYVRELNDEELNSIFTGFLILPGVLVTEDSEEAWKICEALAMLLQNYGQIFEIEHFVDIATGIHKMILGKNTLESLIFKAESVILQAQATINNSSTPYKLSKRFLTSILGDEQ